jgi:hypothetical protein
MIIKLNDTKISLHTLFNLNLLTELCETLLFLYINIITNLKTQEKLATVDVHSQKKVCRGSFNQFNYIKTAYTMQSQA